MARKARTTGTPRRSNPRPNSALTARSTENVVSSVAMLCGSITCIDPGPLRLTRRPCGRDCTANEKFEQALRAGRHHPRRGADPQLRHRWLLYRLALVPARWLRLRFLDPVFYGSHRACGRGSLRGPDRLRQFVDCNTSAGPRTCTPQVREPRDLRTDSAQRRARRDADCRRARGLVAFRRQVQRDPISRPADMAEEDALGPDRS